MKDLFNKVGYFLLSKLKKIGKSIVRNPFSIILLLQVIACMLFTFQIYNHSIVICYTADTTIALLLFVHTLFSFLSVITYLFFIQAKTFAKKLMMISVYWVMLASNIAICLHYVSIMTPTLELRILDGRDVSDVVSGLTNINQSLILYIVLFVLSIAVIFVDKYFKNKKKLKKEMAKNVKQI